MKAPDLKWKPFHITAAVTLLIASVTASARNGTDRDDDQQMRRNVMSAYHNLLLLEQCIVEDGSQNLGTCMTLEECVMLGGTASGYCVEDFGVCCLVARSCGEETSLNNTYFVDPRNDEVGACSLTIYRQHSNICQIRLDFLSLQLSHPDPDGNCNDDFFTVTSGTNKVPVICGENTGQHMYADVDPTAYSVTLTVDRFTSSSRTWTIRISQIDCDSRYRAPPGCLQYFTATSGTVESFNFKTAAPPMDPATSSAGTRQLANLDYGVCIQRASGYCGIVWERDTSEDTLDGGLTFTVSRNLDAILPGLPGTPYAGESGDICLTDYVGIPGGTFDVGVPGGTVMQSDRYCSLGFPLSVTSTSTPFALYVKTDENEMGDMGNRGFRLNYRQKTSC